MTAEDEISVLFSGGSDSTLAAALMCEQFEKVHLLTFYHSGIPYTEKSRINAKRLMGRFGKNKIRHVFISVEELFKKLYYSVYLRDIVCYKGYMIPCICYACQIAMHTTTILYNLENNISFACDGYKREQEHLYAFMSEKGIDEIRKLYKTFQIESKQPVYNTVRTDWVLYELGITPKRNVKFPHENLHFHAQHWCPTGTLVNAYLLGYYFPLFGKEASYRVSVKYWQEKIRLAKDYLRVRL